MPTSKSTKISVTPTTPTDKTTISSSTGTSSSTTSSSTPTDKTTSGSTTVDNAPVKQNSSRKSRPRAKTKKRNPNCSESPYKPIRVCCNMPPPQPPVVYRPDKCCYEKVKGPFKNPIPTPYQRFLDKFKDKCCRSVNLPQCCQPKPVCCDEIREYKVCRAELQRLREERWKEQERKAILEEKRRQEWMDQQYKTQAQKWEQTQEKCERDRERRKALLKQIVAYRKELKGLKEEARLWRRHQQNLMTKQQHEQEDIWVKEYSQREDERRWEQEKLRMHQENNLMAAQMQALDSTDMKVPELEELRRMFVPVEHGPKETFEYFVLEPRPGEEEIRREAEEKMRCLMGLRDTHGIHLNLSDRAKKKTTIQLAMGPKLTNGEREQTCKILSTPGALCSACGDDSTTPSVVIPQCLKPLMQTLTYRVNEIDTPLLSMKAFTCGNDGERSNGKEVPLESGPNFNGDRLYGTIVLPKGKGLSPFYTQPYNVTF